MKEKQTYQTIWRWHFYAGLFFTPFLLVLAVTGGIYLFKSEIENHLYADLYKVAPQAESMPASHLISAVTQHYPDAAVTRFRPGETADRSTEVGIMDGNESKTVFVNPYTMQLMGSLRDEDRVMKKLEKIHGELMAGTAGDRLVELAACWAIILILTGLYLWKPHRKKQLGGVLLPRLSKGKKIFFRDLHAVPAFWISAGMFFLIITGLPWSGLWGTQVQNLATNAGAGYPPSIWVGEAPVSNVKTKEVADVGWAAENLPVPESVFSEYVQLSIDDVMTIIEERNIAPGYDLFIPQSESGVFTVSSFPAKAEQEVTMHMDQYSGTVLADYRYADYKPAGKIIAMGITLHKGSQFGMVNKLVGLAVCLGIIFIIISGVLLWHKRKHSPPPRPNKQTAKKVFAVMAALGIIFPLAGASMLVVFTADWAMRKRKGVKRA